MAQKPTTQHHDGYRPKAAVPYEGRNLFFCGICQAWETPGQPCAHIVEILAWYEPMIAGETDN